MQISKKLEEKLKGLPDKPGVYFMRNRAGRVIYVGKASSLRSRVSHYFHKRGHKRGQPMNFRKCHPAMFNIPPGKAVIFE